MKKLLCIFFVAVIALYYLSPTAKGASILEDWLINVDGTVISNVGSLPSSIDVSGFDFTSGTGVLVWNVSTPGDHSIITYLDHTVNELPDDEYGYQSCTLCQGGLPPVGLSWEIDNPTSGDIVSNVNSGMLDNTNAVPLADPSDLAGDNDVAMAIGWDILLGADEVAEVTFFTEFRSLANIIFVDFNLFDADPLTSEEVPPGSVGGPIVPGVRFTSSLNVVPEPSTMLLIATGLVGMAGFRRKFKS
jgi:hypothetical protein